MRQRKLGSHTPPCHRFSRGGGAYIQKKKYKNKCDVWAVCNLYCKKGVASCVKVLVHKGLHHMLVS